MHVCGCKISKNLKSGVQAILEPFISFDFKFWKYKFGCCQERYSNKNGQIWIFTFCNITIHFIKNMDQFLHMDITFQQDIRRCYYSFSYAKCSRIARKYGITYEIEHMECNLRPFWEIST